MEWPHFNPWSFISQISDWESAGPRYRLDRRESVDKVKMHSLSLPELYSSPMYFLHIQVDGDRTSRI